MTYAISDNFDSPTGRWPEVAPWDSTEQFNSVNGFLATQEHVDLRSFRNLADRVGRPQTDLEALPQTDLDGLPQTDLETKLLLNTLEENWEFTDASGTNADLVVGKQSAFNGWSGATFTTTGSALACTLQSVISEEIDLSGQDFLSIIFPHHITYDNTSYIQLCSEGDLGAGHDSVAVDFSNNSTSLPEMRLDLSLFAQSGFDLSKVTGVRIRLEQASAPAADTALYIMAIRAVKADWAVQAIDFDTRLGALVAPVTLDGNDYSGNDFGFEFIRGDGTKSDPIPADTAINLYFYPGGEAGNDATGGDYNILKAIFREVKDDGAGTGAHLEVALGFNDSDVTIQIQRLDSTGGSPGSQTGVAAYFEDIGTALDFNAHYVLRSEVKGTQVIVSLYKTDINRRIGDFVWQLSTTVSDQGYTYRNGRVGFSAGFLTKDAYLDQIDVAPSGYASLTTQVYESRTPIDGAQLSAIFASDENLWQSFDGSDVLIDQTKSLSGGGSYRTAKSLTTNTFIVDDWTESYLDFAIWVPGNVTRQNQPTVVLNTDTGQEMLAMPRLQPAQWNILHFDLGLFRNLISGIGYSFTIQAAADPDKPLGFFWVDETVIGRRRVRWSVRATDNGPWRRFKDLVNNPVGAVHFLGDERGTRLQLRAEALTTDAWVSSFKLHPRYAQLGLPVYDQAFEKR